MSTAALLLNPTPALAWTWLSLSGALEVASLIVLKRACGPWRPGLLFGGLVLEGAGFLLFTVAMRTLPAGTSYAVCAGIGAAGGVIAGMILLGESHDLRRVAGVALIVIGIAVLKISS